MIRFKWVYTVALLWAWPLSVMGSDLIDNNNGTVSDRETGLTWQQTENCCSGQRLARNYCEALVLAGHDDWRLPNIKELESIVDDEANHPSINTVFFPLTATNILGFWSSTAYAADTHYFWKVNFETGDLNHYSVEEEELRIRCVRGGEE